MKVVPNKGPSLCFLKEKSEVEFKTETLAYLPVFTNIKQLINSYGQLNCNIQATCYAKVRRNSSYDQAGCNSCNDEAGKLHLTAVKTNLVVTAVTTKLVVSAYF